MNARSDKLKSFERKDDFQKSGMIPTKLYNSCTAIQHTTRDDSVATQRHLSHEMHYTSTTNFKAKFLLC